MSEEQTKTGAATNPSYGNVISLASNNMMEWVRDAEKPDIYYSVSDAFSYRIMLTFNTKTNQLAVEAPPGQWVYNKLAK